MILMFPHNADGRSGPAGRKKGGMLHRKAENCLNSARTMPKSYSWRNATKGAKRPFLANSNKCP